VTLISDVFDYWRLDKTEISSLTWNGSPSTTILENIPVTYLINPAKLFKSQIERKIDEAVENL
jgi:hypothetical protein